MPTQWAELTGPGGHAFRFRVAAYEFPTYVAKEEGDYDANWVRVDASATDGAVTWRWNSEAVWLTWDLPGLRDWFVAVLEKRDPTMEWCSLEPFITFTARADGVTADVDCGFLGGSDVRETHTLILQPTDDELRAAIAVIDEAMEEFPSR